MNFFIHTINYTALKAARRQLNVTQEAVAEALFVSRQTISSWENERSYPDIQSLIKLSHYYQLSLDVLLKEDTGMVEEISRKEVQAKINTIWGVSYIINLIFVGLILFSQFGNSSFFQMGTGVRIALITVMVLNIGLLMYVTGEKDKLKDGPKRIGNYLRPLLLALILLGGAISVAGLYLSALAHPQGSTLLGMGVGIMSVTVAVWLVSHYLKRHNSD